MSQDYNRVQDSYAELHELQPPPYLYNPGVQMMHQSGNQHSLYQLSDSVPQPSTSTSTGCHNFQQDILIRSSNVHNIEDLSNSQYDMSVSSSSSSGMLSSATSSSYPYTYRSDKPPSSYAGSAFDEDHPGSSEHKSEKKQNHSQIEKRRRDKMNTYIIELSKLVPMCRAMSRKVDKLTALRLAVQHVKSILGAISACPMNVRPRPAFMSEPELNALVLQAAGDSFVFVIGCDRGRLLFVSSSVTKSLKYEQNELLGQSIFDIIHPKDISKVKEQLSSSDLSPRERYVDAKTMQPIKADVAPDGSRLCPGARRSFFCRIKCKDIRTPSDEVKEENVTGKKHKKKQQSDKKYCVIHCTGYLKSWAPAEIRASGTVRDNVEGCEDNEACNLSCLVAIGRALKDMNPEAPLSTTDSSINAPPEEIMPKVTLHYMSRHGIDGKFLFVDQRVTLALGYLPQEMMGTSLYEYIDSDEIDGVTRTHKTALLRRESSLTSPYSIKKKDGTKTFVMSHFKPFRNPWTKDMECLVADNVVLKETVLPENSPPAFNMFEDTSHSLNNNMAISESELDIQCLINPQVESHKIGNSIVEDVLCRSATESSPEAVHEIEQDLIYSYESPQIDGLLSSDASNFTPVLNNVPLTAVATDTSSMFGDHTTALEVDINGGPSLPGSPMTPIAIDGNGEAAMAVIMSLLEADAGFGGPMDLSFALSFP